MQISVTTDIKERCATMKKDIMKKFNVFFMAMFISTLLIFSYYYAGQTPVEGEYIIEYYSEENGETPALETTNGVYGVDIKLLTIEELGFTKEGYVFEGWRINRTVDDKWYLRDETGKCGWYSLNQGALPEGFTFALRNNGGVIGGPAKEGIVRLYAQWGGKEFKVVYHMDMNSDSSGDVTKVIYGELTPLLSINELGFSKENMHFTGWVFFREIDWKWRIKDSEGKSTWKKIDNSKLAKGIEYLLYPEDYQISKAATSGIVHAYAQWEND